MICLRRIATFLVAGGWLVTAAAAGDSPLGRKIENFELHDYRGKNHSLEGLRGKQIVVVAFLGTECPLVKLYGPRLVALAKEFDFKGVAFLGINSNSQDNITEIAAYARLHEITFPILKDVGNAVADKFGAVRTPEVFILDRERVVRYRGRIDDQYSVGTARKEPTRHDLKAALVELLAGKTVSQPQTESVGCHIGRIRTPVANSPVTYSNQISRLLQNRCVECHRPGEIAPFSLTDYSEVAGWAKMIEEVVDDNRMPPWHADPKIGKFIGDRRLSDAEKQLIRDWVKNGAPEGIRAELPPPQKYTTGWQLPRTPDKILYMRDKPFPVPAEGIVQYRWFTVDTDFNEDKWLQAVEVLPGNRAVVHHVIVFARPKGTKEFRDEETGGFVAAYVPGLRARQFPTGMAKRLAAGVRLFFQVHYVSVGSPQTDRTSVGFVFADPKSVTHEVQTIGTANLKLAIPPGAANHLEQTKAVRFPPHGQLLALMPHMHVRGKAFLFQAVLPDGTTEVLLDVPHYDFNWQTAYQLQTPHTFPPNTRIRAIGRFDNSADNLNNPDPTRTVKWGQQSRDEMLLGYFDVATPRIAPPADPNVPVESAELQRAQRIVDRFDENGDEKISKSELPEKMGKIFDRLDLDRSGALTADEFLPILDQIPGS